MEIPRAMKAIFNTSARLVTLERRILIEKTKGKTIEMQVLWREPMSAEVRQTESHCENNDQKNGAYCSPDGCSPSALQLG